MRKRSRLSDMDPETAAGCAFILLLPFILMLLVVGQWIHVSDGYRDGIVQKFSHRGIAVKTWEGDLALEGMKIRGTKDGMSVGNVWAFTVDDQSKDVVDLLQSLKPNERVRVHYKQQLTTLPWNGESRYRVIRVERIAD